MDGSLLGGVFEVCIFPLAACNYSAPGCRMQQLQTALIRFSHRSGFPDRDVRSITIHSGSAPDSPAISIPSKKDDLCELRGRSMRRIRKRSLSPARDASMGSTNQTPGRIPCCLTITHVPTLQHRFSAAQMAACPLTRLPRNLASTQLR